MAAMAELSPEFYEKFGVKTANELTGWLNSMDANLRQELRDMSDRNTDLLRSEMRAGFAEIKAELDTRLAGFESRMLRTMMGFWITSLLSMVGTLIALR